MENFEIPSTEKKQQDRQMLYPERPSEGIESKIAMLADFEAGRVEKIPITPEEREEIQKFEDVLGSALEKIFAITPKEATFFVEYFLTEEGKKDFEALTGQSLGSTEESALGIERALHGAALLLEQMDAKKRGNLAGHSRDYSEKLLLEQFSKTRDTDGRITTVEASAPVRVKMLLTPAENLAKITALKKFKEKTKQYAETLDVSMSGKSEAFQQVLSGVLKLYQSRVNGMLVENRRDIFALQRKVEVLGEDALTGDEQELLSQAVGAQNVERSVSRYDKFLFGAASEYDAMGQRNQVGESLKQFADQLEEEYLANTVLRDEQIKEKGLDPDKIAEMIIPIDQVEKLAEETLRAYGLLSDHPASEYTSDRSGPAPDNKWQFVARDEFKTMNTDGKRKVVTCGRGNQSVAGLISVTLGHEIEGHVLQSENKSKIPLRLFERMGSGRASIFAECGAMNNQDAVSRDAFGFASPPASNYIRAMEKKFEGGNYLDCVVAFYDSSLKSTRLQKTLGKISPEEFDKQCEKDLKLAINRARRLFQNSPDFSSVSSSLTRSKDTVYLEQAKLFRELKKHNLEKYVFVGGANLDALLFLMKSGFLDPRDIEEPKQYSLQIWDRLKSEYMLPSEK